MRFTRLVFLVSGIYGIVVIAPQYVMEDMIAREPVRFRPAMLVAVLEKLIFVVPMYLLCARGRVNGQVVGFASVDLLWPCCSRSPTCGHRPLLHPTRHPQYHELVPPFMK